MNYKADLENKAELSEMRNDLMERVNSVMAKANEFKDSFYKYLKIQSIFVALNSLLIVLQPIKYCDNCSVSKTYFAQIYFIYFRIYSSSIFEMVTLYCSWLSGLNCCVLLFNKRIAKFIL